jgi:hypothetical protein
MPTGNNGELPAGDNDPGSADHNRRALTGWPPSYAWPDTPPPMSAELIQLQAAFPAFSFSISRGWRGLTFEAWRNAETPGLYALITPDASELRRELEAYPQPVPSDTAPVTKHR